MPKSHAKTRVRHAAYLDKPMGLEYSWSFPVSPSPEDIAIFRYSITKPDYILELVR